MKKRILSIALATIMTSTLLMGCGEKTPEATQTAAPAVTESVKEETAATVESEPITITYANFNASGGNEATLNSMYEAFHKQYPDINVEIETIAFENFGAYASKGLLENLSDIDAKAINQTALGAFNYDGVQYGLPENFSTVIMVYNKDLFDQAGIDYPTSDWTREDVDNAAMAIRALGDDIFGIFQPVTYNEFYKVAAQYGGSLLSADKKSFTINSDENVKALESLVNRVQVTNVQPTTAQMGGMGDWDLFESGRLGMIPTGTWCFNTFAEACDFAWDICVEPGQTNKATHFFANALVVNASATDEAKAAAKTWLTFLASSQETADIRLAAGWDLPALSDMNALSSYLEITPPENRTAVFESLDSLVLPPIINDYSQMSDILTDCIAKAADGVYSAKEALDDAQAQCESKITLQ